MRWFLPVLLAPMMLVLPLVAMAESSPELKHPQCVHQMDSCPLITVRNPKRAWGTQKAIRLFRKAVKAVHAQFPNTPKLVVGDLSFRGGGRMRPHRSHRDGRDIDVGYYFKDGRSRSWFQRARSRTLDVARTWALFKALIDTGEVEYIFVAYPLQRALYRHALKSGETKRSLRRIFQWPRPWRKKAGIIRLERGHADHFHVRFKKSRPKKERHARRPAKKDDPCGS